jgi:hypothetical protein
MPAAGFLRRDRQGCDLFHSGRREMERRCSATRGATVKEAIPMPTMAHSTLTRGKNRSNVPARSRDPGRGVIFCNQGVWWGGAFYSEYPADNGVHEEAILDLPGVCRKWGASWLVLSGGMTQSSVPGISEAQGAEALLHAVDAEFPAGFAIGRDEAALDLPENVLTGTLTGRLLMGPTDVMSTIVIGCTHEMKSRRVGEAVSALGLSDRARFVGLYPPSRLARPLAAITGEEAMASKCSSDSDPMALGDWAEQRRRTRYHGTMPYEARLDELAKIFPETIGNLERLRGTPRSHADLEPLRKALHHEAIMPKRG